MNEKRKNGIKTRDNTSYILLLGHCRFAKIPLEFFICDLFTKLVPRHATNHSPNVVRHTKTERKIDKTALIFVTLQYESNRKNRIGLRY